MANSEKLLRLLKIITLVDKPNGALVSSVEPGGPAARAGLQAGDIIQQADGSKIEESTELQRIIGDHNPGDTVKLKVWRDKSSREFSVKLGEQTDGKQAKTADQGAEGNGKLGLTVRELDATEQKRLGVTGGLLVEGVSGPAARAGIRQGDVVLAVNNQRISNIEQLRKQANAAGKRVPLLIQRGELQQFVVLKLD